MTAALQLNAVLFFNAVDAANVPRMQENSRNLISRTNLRQVKTETAPDRLLLRDPGAVFELVEEEN
ncbi:MAG: hypothetical protein LAO79_06755 [Acidobacteriia bacterium]|nr:hypothetical protein [Terriglobia bacterium]